VAPPVDLKRLAVQLGRACRARDDLRETEYREALKTLSAEALLLSRSDPARWAALRREHDPGGRPSP
jgi:hypothetical protein